MKLYGVFIGTLSRDFCRSVFHQPIPHLRPWYNGLKPLQISYCVLISTKYSMKTDFPKYFGCIVEWVDIGIRTTVRLGKVHFVTKVCKICLKSFLVHWLLPHRCTLLGPCSTNGSKRITRFRGILSLIQVYIFEIYVKFWVFLNMRGFEKKILDPSYVPVRFLRPREGARTRSKIFFCRFRMFYIKMKLLQGDRTTKKIFHEKSTHPNV
jgi:hypothetical protein